ncbi:hypothetical protein ACFY2V_39855 [Streptomyces eurythermus]|uniref:hypothetical protein n=1 Tax=Streptomyces eurythermus TaxID=42237 RepID=UPI003679A4C1
MQWEVEALDPAEFQRLVLAAVDPYIDNVVLTVCVAEEARRRAAVRGPTGGAPPADG